MLVAPYEEDVSVAVTSCILVAEADPTLCSRLQAQLQDEYEITFAERGADIPALLERQPVDLVLLDVALPRSTASICCARFGKRRSTCR